jgi:serine/threonine protein kinase
VDNGQKKTVGPWTLHERLGSGGNASVWRATRADSDGDKDVALKVINAKKVEREIDRLRRAPGVDGGEHLAPVFLAGDTDDVAAEEAGPAGEIEFHCWAAIFILPPGGEASGKRSRLLRGITLFR